MENKKHVVIELYIHNHKTGEETVVGRFNETQKSEYAAAVFHEQISRMNYEEIRWRRVE